MITGDNNLVLNPEIDCFNCNINVSYPKACEAVHQFLFNLEMTDVWTQNILQYAHHMLD